MSLFKSYTFTWWQLGVFKVALLAIGAAAGAYWHEVFAEYIPTLLGVAVLASAYVVLVALRQTHGTVSEFVRQVGRKRKNKEKILSLLAEKGEVGNEDIRQALGVSARTVVSYMDELEEAGKVKQVGETGQSVVYKLK